MFDTSTILTLVCLTVAAIVLSVLFIVLMILWLWMLPDWQRRQESDPATAEKYKIQIILGWPVNYYLAVYRRQGPAPRAKV
jgi:hypothetical protein